MKILKKTLIVIAVLLAADIAVRIVTFGIFYYRISLFPEIKQRYYDTTVAFREHAGAFFTSEPSEMMVPIFNEDGSSEMIGLGNIEKKHLMYPDFSDEKKRGMYRIICIGGSTTQHGYVESLNEKMKSAFGQDRIEVLNFGVSSANIGANEYLVREKFAAYSPDMIIVYHGFNDIYRATPLTEYEEGVLGFYPWKSYGIADLIRRKGNMGFIPPDNYLESYKSNVLENEKYYKSLIRFCRDNGIELVLSTFARPGYETIPSHERKFYELSISFFWAYMIDANTYSELLDLHNAMVTGIAAGHGLLIVPVFEELKGGRDVFTDNCHLTKPEFSRQADIFFNALRKEIENELKGRQENGN